MLTDRTRIREGMAVYSSDGEKLGKVFSCDASGFTIEKGFFFPKDYPARYEEVSSIDGDAIRLAMTKDTFVQLRERGEREGGLERGAADEEVRMPIAEEELDVVKHDRPAGEARLRKEVETETKRIDVPVTRERVHVERTPVSEAREAAPGDKPFEGGTLSMPVHEEEVEIRKRPVVKEEVRLRKDRFTEHRAADADVRKERVDLEGEGRTLRGDEDLGTPRRE